MRKRTDFEIKSCGEVESPFWEDKSFDTEGYNKQIEEYGFADYELWNLDATILEFIIPRLVRFKEITYSYPSNFQNIEDWHKALDEIIDGLKCGLNLYMSDCERKKFRKAGLLMFKYFNDLWD